MEKFIIYINYFIKYKNLDKTIKCLFYQQILKMKKRQH